MLNSRITIPRYPLGSSRRGPKWAGTKWARTDLGGNWQPSFCVWMIPVQRVISNKRDRHQSALREVLGDPRDCGLTPGIVGSTPDCLWDILVFLVDSMGGWTDSRLHVGCLG